MNWRNWTHWMNWTGWTAADAATLDGTGRMPQMSRGARGDEKTGGPEGSPVFID